MYLISLFIIIITNLYIFFITKLFDFSSLIIKIFVILFYSSFNNFKY